MLFSPADRCREADRLLPLLRGPRRWLVGALVLGGLGQAATGGGTAFLLARVLDGPGHGRSAVLLGSLFLLAVVVGLLRKVERVWAERLSQGYVHELRVRLVEASLLQGRRTSLGVTVARTTNDLTSVRNWIALGIAPLAAGLPLMLGSVVALGLLSPALGAALLATLVTFAVGLALLAPLAFRRSRRVRRARGRIAGQIADTVVARTSIVSGGGRERELRRIARMSAVLVDRSIGRARAAGWLRGLASGASAVAAAAVVTTGVVAGISTATVAGALTLIGMISGPVHDMGRVVEYRQAYRAARRIIAPVLAEATAASAARRPTREPPSGSDAGLSVRGIRLPDGSVLSDLDAEPGSRVHLDLPDRASAERVLQELAGVVPGTGQCWLEGRDLAAAEPRQRRMLVGYAAQGMPLERGPLKRAVRYRRPRTSEEQARRLLTQFGLDEALRRCPNGSDTVLRHGGEPLTVPERARLLLARAMLDDPPLLVLDHLDADLDSAGRDLLRQRLRTYPGVVVLASEDPRQLVDLTHHWTRCAGSAASDGCNRESAT